jgi:amidophosphoribosyltransferase
MSDPIKHECGIALIRLLKPLEYYQYKYGSWRYGLQKMYLLMEKQRNRGQDGAGLVTLKFDLAPGNKYIHRQRSVDDNAINQIFKKIYSNYKKVERDSPKTINDAVWAKENLPFAGEVYLGHLRYGTFGKNKKNNIHPVLRENNWRSRNLVLAGNFNLTNVDELFQKLVSLGQHPKDFSDTVTILENIGHFLDVENQKLFDQYKRKRMSNTEITELIEQSLNLKNILSQSSKKWDGGYTIAGMIGHGDAFITRDPWGIRPAYYYQDDEIVVAASERAVIQTAINADAENVKELERGHALIIKKDGAVSLEQIRKPQSRKSCSFERIYFSRGSDINIYKERKKLGELLTPAVLDAVDHDLKNTVFSFIPNTAETAFYGMQHEIENYTLAEKKRHMMNKKDCLTEKDIDDIVAIRPRIEKTTIKDIKLRTFITKDESRNEMVSHVYDISYGTLKKGKDNLVVIDDSIVRGTTLKYSILRILDRLEPKRIVVASSSPQIRYPDCYGIDMAKLNDFIAFKAAINLLKENNREDIINKVYKECKEQLKNKPGKYTNSVKQIYEPFTHQQISKKIAQMLSDDNHLNAEVRIVYQTIENLHKACPRHTGDWYFTGNYPTQGGNKVVLTSFVNFVEGINKRAYSSF